MMLVFHQGALGDLALTFPLLRGAGMPITLVAPWQRAELAARVLPGVSVMDIEMFEFTRMFAAGGPTHISPAVRDLFANTQCVISFIGAEFEHWRQNITSRMPDAKCVFIDPRPTDTPRQHILAGHLAQLASQGLTLKPEQPTIAGDPKGPIVIHPGSGGLVKCWPPDRFEELIRRSLKGGRGVVPILGEVELDRWPKPQLQRWQEEFGAVTCQTPCDLIPLLSKASLFIGNDAGPTHLAAQLGIPTLALFGPTCPERWGPTGPSVRILASPDGPAQMDWLDVDRVVEEASDFSS